MKTDPYLQLPLPIFKTFPPSFLDAVSQPNETLLGLMAYGAVRNGQLLWEKTNGRYEPEDGSLSDRRQEALEEFVRESDSNPSWPSDFDPACDIHIATAAFFSHLDETPFESFEKIAVLYRKQASLLDLVEDNPEQSPMVRIRYNLLEDWRRGKLKNFDMLGFCAIRSMLGRKDFRRITRAQIAVRMMGYRSEEEFAKKATESDRSFLPSVRRVSLMIGRLQKRGLIQVVRPSKRENFFSVRLSKDKLWEAVKDFKLRSIAKDYENRNRDQDLQQLLRDQRKAVKKSFLAPLYSSHQCQDNHLESENTRTLSLRSN